VHAAGSSALVDAWLRQPTAVTPDA
jgi:hypothetical protein